METISPEKNKQGDAIPWTGAASRQASLWLRLSPDGGDALS